MIFEGECKQESGKEEMIFKKGQHLSSVATWTVKAKQE
jgi:hypothetical protein